MSYSGVFCENFGTFGSILHFKNTFKYVGGFNVNHENGAFRLALCQRPPGNGLHYQ